MQARAHDIQNLGRLKKRSDFLLAGGEGRKWVSKTVVVQVVDDPACAASSAHAPDTVEQDSVRPDSTNPDSDLGSPCAATQASLCDAPALNNGIGLDIDALILDGSSDSESDPDLTAALPAVYAPLGAYRNRFGVTASKKVGNAVERARVKRRLRAAIKDIYAVNGAGDGLQHGIAIVMIGRKETLTVEYKRLKGDLAWCLRRLGVLADSAPVRPAQPTSASTPASGCKMSQDTSQKEAKNQAKNHTHAPIQGDVR